MTLPFERDNIGTMTKVSHYIRLKRIRESLGYNIKELADLVGITPQGLSFLERGITRGGRISTWKKLESVLKYPIDEMRKPY